MNTPSLPWVGRPRLWSFADLIECKIPFLMQAYEELRGICDTYYQYPDLRAELRDDEKERNSRYSFFYELEMCKGVIDDDRIALALWSLQVSLSGKNPMTPELLISKLETIKHDLILVMSQRKFAYIPKDLAGYFEQDNLFGEAVYEKFPKMRGDIKDAGNCIAAQLPTAAVFHLMRVAELGFRFAAKRAGVAIATHKGKPVPIDFATWEKVIQGFNTVSSKLCARPKSNATEAKIQLCADLSDQCSYFRDMWRDKTMHARKRYDMHEAQAAFFRVQQFAQNLAGGR